VAGTTGYGPDGDNYNFVLARYNTDGTLDAAFSEDGKLVADFGSFAQSVAIQNEDKIIVAGSTEYFPDSFALVRYNTNGTLDTTFSKDGKLTDYVHEGITTYNSTAIQKDGKIVVAGVAQTGNFESHFALARYNTDGTLDNGFSKDGKLTTDFPSNNVFGQANANAVAIQSDGKILFHAMES
jgi:uncharacterized delta-60 repeat protein